MIYFSAGRVSPHSSFSEVKVTVSSLGTVAPANVTVPLRLPPLATSPPLYFAFLAAKWTSFYFFWFGNAIPYYSRKTNFINEKIQTGKENALTNLPKNHLIVK
jgi:hypothetical protein